MNTKPCSSCKEELPLDCFAKNRVKKDGLQGSCTPCRLEYNRVRRREKKEEINAGYRRRYRENLEHSRRRDRNKHLKKKYGIDNEDYEAMMESQGGVCWICSSECPTGQHLAVDHCHSTGEVRGLLCANCNRGLGLFKDNLESLSKAIEYLKRSK